MRAAAVRIVHLNRSHIRACEAIAAGSEPWRTLGEKMEFSRHVAAKEAFVCLVGGETAGFVVFSAVPVFARGGYLRAIGVSPSMRRRGIGNLLLSYAEKTTAVHSANLYLCVSSFNRVALAFYRSRGYRKIGAIPGLIIEGASEYIFWKPLLRDAKRIKRKGGQ